MKISATTTYPFKMEPTQIKNRIEKNPFSIPFVSGAVCTLIINMLWQTVCHQFQHSLSSYLVYYVPLIVTTLLDGISLALAAQLNKSLYVPTPLLWYLVCKMFAYDRDRLLNEPCVSNLERTQYTTAASRLLSDPVQKGRTKLANNIIIIL